jgi:hypothetical protein
MRLRLWAALGSSVQAVLLLPLLLLAGLLLAPAALLLLLLWGWVLHLSLQMR